MARPKKELNDLPGDWQKTLLTEMSQGGSLTEVKAMLSVSNDLFSRLLKENTEFSVAVQRGLQLSESWWLRQGRENLYNKSFSSQLWALNMRNRFAWTDKKEIEARITNTLSLSALYDASQELANLRKKGEALL